MRLVGLFDAEVRGIVPERGTPKNASNAKALLGLGAEKPQGSRSRHGAQPARTWPGEEVGG
jgi:hypothetical protein